jgi:hypothetical protein
VLGFWAQHPDELIDDWHLASPFSSITNTLKTFTEVNLAAGGTAFVSLSCMFACITAPITCQVCVQKTSKLVGASIETVSSLPDLSDWKDEMFTGMGHHIDMKPTALGVSAFDDRHGFFTDDSGPIHLRDSLETALTALSDAIGLRVKFDASDGPKNYEISLPGSGDFHANSVHRGISEWDAQSMPHTQFTPLDNLAMFGWQKFEALAGAGSVPAPGIAKDQSKAAEFLGYPLHALGDATVPMHVVNTLGWGHRPYEDALENMLLDPKTPLLAENNEIAQVNLIDDILGRALTFRSMITDWRNAHPTLKNEVPVRDLVTAVAAGTFQKAMARAGEIFDSNVSLAYLIEKDNATAFYETANRRAIYLDLMEDGIAAEIAFLASAMEVMP